MKLTLANVKDLKRGSDNKLTKRVCNYVISRWATTTIKSISSQTCSITAVSPALLENLSTLRHDALLQAV